MATENAQVTKELNLAPVNDQLEAAYVCCLETDTLLTLLERAHDSEGNGVDSSACGIALRSLQTAEEIIQTCQSELRRNGGAA